MVKVLVLMADYGHDPTETAVPYHAFKNAGFDVKFATEQGKIPQCDSKMLEGITQLIVGAQKCVIAQYNSMTESSEWNSPLSWSAQDFTLDDFDLVFLPGGHERSVRQVIDSAAVHSLLANYFPKTSREGGTKPIGAVCHGVMVLSESKRRDGKSLLYGCVTTALPTRFEQLAFWGTRLFLGDYYKTYGACSENVEELVTKYLAKPDDFKNSLSPAPFVVEDKKFNYVSARFPGDAELLGQKLVELVNSLST